MSEQWFDGIKVCDMCGHEWHHDADCGEQVGYDHLNGDHECGCPGSLASQLAQAWDEGFEVGHDTLPGEGRHSNPHRVSPETDEPSGS